MSYLLLIRQEPADPRGERRTFRRSVKKARSRIDRRSASGFISEQLTADAELRAEDFKEALADWFDAQMYEDALLRDYYDDEDRQAAVAETGDDEPYDDWPLYPEDYPPSCYDDAPRAPWRNR